MVYTVVSPLSPFLYLGLSNDPIDAKGCMAAHSFNSGEFVASSNATMRSLNRYRPFRPTMRAFKFACTNERLWRSFKR
jgi:hypothetical protein